MYTIYLYIFTDYSLNISSVNQPMITAAVHITNVSNGRSIGSISPSPSSICVSFVCCLSHGCSWHMPSTDPWVCSYAQRNLDSQHLLGSQQARALSIRYLASSTRGSHSHLERSIIQQSRGAGVQQFLLMFGFLLLALVFFLDRCPIVREHHCILSILHTHLMQGE